MAEEEEERKVTMEMGDRSLPTDVASETWFVYGDGEVRRALLCGGLPGRSSCRGRTSADTSPWFCG